jgi:hypothetical protein
MRTKSKNRPIKLKYKKLGRQRAWGQAYKETNLIEVEKNTKGKLRLRCILHEAYHCIAPEWSESRVRKSEKLISDLLWNQNYRQVDNYIK